MKVKVLMATLVTTLLLGIQGFAASPCDFACVDPCASCNGFAPKCDLFSGLKKLVSGVRCNPGCDPCDAVTACHPCDEFAFCGPCDDICCMPKIGLGGRLKGLFASQACYAPCNDNGCYPCDVVSDCDPCGYNACSTPKFTLRGLFGGFRGCNSDCGPCDVVGDCGPCDFAGNGNCFAGDCDPCGACGNNYCGPRGHLLDLPRVSLKKLFGGVRFVGCSDNGCDPCGEVGSRFPCPCDKCSR